MHATLSVNLSALCANYRLLKTRHKKNNIAAVVKANAYGLGVEGISTALWNEGCREFFTATLNEGIELRKILPQAKIGIFQGIFKGEEKEYTAHNLTPVINDISQVESSLRVSETSATVHIDTGMTRLGLCESDLNHPILSKLQTPNSALTILSHLSCAGTPEHPKNSEQLSRLKKALQFFPQAKVSFANSSGLFLPEDYHFDLGRPGCALYGINPTEQQNPMRHVATLSAPILQIRTLDRDEEIGYGATQKASKGNRIAIIGIGYADGYNRLLSNRGFAYIEGKKLPLIGRVSMDMIAIDISALPEGKITADSRAELIGEQQPVDEIAELCETIGYEIFTSIGNRVKRVYL